MSRAATGVGANYRAARRSRSDAEFAARVDVVLEEADESAFWMEVVTEGGLSTQQQAIQLLDVANQLTADLRGVEHHRPSPLQPEINLKSI